LIPTGRHPHHGQWEFLVGVASLENHLAQNIFTNAVIAAESLPKRLVMEHSVSTKIKVGIDVVEGVGSMLIPNTDLRFPFRNRSENFRATHVYMAFETECLYEASDGQCI
jgi:hypothetical protein